MQLPKYRIHLTQDEILDDILLRLREFVLQLVLGNTHVVVVGKACIQCIPLWVGGLFERALASHTYLDSEQETKIYILICFGFRQVFGQSWAQERAHRPRLEKRHTHQQTIARGIDSKAPRKLKYKIWH